MMIRNYKISQKVSLLTAFPLLLFMVTSSSAITKKKFDFIVGKNGNFKEAMTAVSKAGGKRFILFFPNGEYNIGVLTGDGNQKTIFNHENVSFVGQNSLKTTVYNKSGDVAEGIKEGIKQTPTLDITGDNAYFQDITFQNKAPVGSGRHVVIKQNSSNFIYKNVRLLSGQDTYTTGGSKTYWEGGEIHGTTDFICGGGDIFFDKVLLYSLKTSAITAPATGAGKWGFVFDSCTIDGTEDGYSFGRNWTEGRAVFLNTIMIKVVSSSGWLSGISGRTNQKLLAEYNSVKPDGSKVSTSDRKIGTVLSESQAAEYTIENVLGSWDPRSITKQVPAPTLQQIGDKLTWNDDESALCWVVFKDDIYHENVTENSYTIPPGDDVKKYSVRGANSMGGLGPVSIFGATDVKINTTVSAQGKLSIRKYDQKTLLIQSDNANKIQVIIASLDGKKVLSRTINSVSAKDKTTISLLGLQSGVYIFKAWQGNLVTSKPMYVRHNF